MHDNPELFKGRDIQYYETIDEALSSVEGNEYTLILVHEGVYTGEWLYIDTPVCILGAGECLLLAWLLCNALKPIDSFGTWRKWKQN